MSELWYERIKDVLFEQKSILKYKEYRSLYKQTLAFHLKMQAQALNTMLWPKWTEEIVDQFNKSFISSIECK